MRNLAILLLTIWTTASAAAADTTNLTAIIKGKRVEFTDRQRAAAVQRSIELLASCAYLNAKPKWGTGGSEPVSITEAQKQSHLQLSFASPTPVAVPIEKVTLQVREMVISLPLVTGGIWVRTNDEVLYLAKFDHLACGNLQKILDEAQNP